MTKEEFKKALKDRWVYVYILVLFIISVIFIFIIIPKIQMKYLERTRTEEEEKKVYIEMDAVVSYSCKEYSVFSSAEFTSFVVFDEPLRDFYQPVILVIDTKNTSNTIDDEVIKVKNRKIDDVNSTGGDMYEYH